jgi:PAS domain-containing protein
MDSNLSLGSMTRLEFVGTHERVDEARAYFARSFGRNPEGVILVDSDGRIIGLDSGACDVLDVDPRRALGMEAREFLADAPSEYLLSWIRDGGGEVAGLYRSQETEFYTPEIVVEQGGVLEELFEFETVEELMEWFTYWAGNWGSSNRGAVALRDGDWMHVWCTWPSGLVPIFPIRFRAMESKAFRTGREILAFEEGICSFEEGNVVPLIIDGSVAALVAVEGDQLEVRQVLDQLAMALRRFIE